MSSHSVPEERLCVDPSVSPTRPAGASFIISGQEAETGMPPDCCYDVCAPSPSWTDARHSLDVYTHFIWLQQSKHKFWTLDTPKNYLPNSWRCQVVLRGVSLLSQEGKMGTIHLWRITSGTWFAVRLFICLFSGLAVHIIFYLCCHLCSS